MGARAVDVDLPEPAVERKADRVRQQLFGRAPSKRPCHSVFACARRQAIGGCPVSERGRRRDGRRRPPGVLVGDAQQRVVAGDGAEHTVERRCGRAPMRPRGRSPAACAGRRLAEWRTSATHSPITRRS